MGPPVFTGCYLKYDKSKPIKCTNGCVGCIPGGGPPPPPPPPGLHLLDDYSGQKFYDGFTFFEAADPTNGFVSYVDQATAYAEGLAGLYSNGQVFMRVENNTIMPTAPTPAGARTTIVHACSRTKVCGVRLYGRY